MLSLKDYPSLVQGRHRHAREICKSPIHEEDSSYIPFCNCVFFLIFIRSRNCMCYTMLLERAALWESATSEDRNARHAPPV